MAALWPSIEGSMDELMESYPEKLKDAFNIRALTSVEAYHAVSAGARAAMCLPEVRLAAGYPAEILALRADSLEQALADPTDRLVIHQGRVASRTTVTRLGPQPPSV